MLNFAIIGCGHIAKSHAKAIAAIEKAKLVAVCDRVTDVMQEYCINYDAIPYTDYNKMFLEQEIDVVCICTPSGTHARIACEAAKNKKHIILEKPIALTLEDADLIINTCKQNNVKLTIVHPNRFRPAIVKLKKLMNERLLGKVSHVNATVRWNRGQEYFDQAPWRGTKEFDGGVLMNQAIHNLDLMLWIAGDVEEVFSMSATRLRDIETEDVSVSVLRFRDGALGVIEAAVTLYERNLEETLSIFGEFGTIQLGGPTVSRINHWNVKAMDEESSSRLINEVNQDPLGKSGHLCIIDDMIQAIEVDREPVITGLDGKNALLLVLSLYESASKKKQVSLSANN